MLGSSPFHWIIALCVLTIALCVLDVTSFMLAFPFWRILPRSGLSKWFSLLALVPPAPLVLLWVMALKPWAGDAPTGAAHEKAATG